MRVTVDNRREETVWMVLALSALALLALSFSF